MNFQQGFINLEDYTKLVLQLIQASPSSLSGDEMCQDLAEMRFLQ